MNKFNTNIIATQNEAKTIGKSSDSVIENRLATKESALSLGCAVSGNYNDNYCVKWEDLSTNAPEIYRVYAETPKIGELVWDYDSKNIDGKEFETGTAVNVVWETTNISYYLSSCSITKYGDKSTQITYSKNDNVITFPMPNYDVSISISVKLSSDRIGFDGDNIVVLSVANTPAERVLATGGVDIQENTESFYKCVSGTVPNPFSGLLNNVVTELDPGDATIENVVSMDYERLPLPFVCGDDTPLGRDNDLALTCCSTKIDVWLKVKYSDITSLEFSANFWTSSGNDAYIDLCKISLYNGDKPDTDICGNSFVNGKDANVFYTATYNISAVDDTTKGWLVHFAYTPNPQYITNSDKSVDAYYWNMRDNLIRTLKITADSYIFKDVIDSTHTRTANEFTIDFDYDEVNWKTLQNHQYAVDMYNEPLKGLYPGMRLKGGIQNIKLTAWDYSSNKTTSTNGDFVCHPLKYPLELYNQQDTTQHLWKIPGTYTDKNEDIGFINGCSPYDVGGNIYYFHDSNYLYDTDKMVDDRNMPISIFDKIGRIPSKRNSKEMHYGFEISFMHPSPVIGADGKLHKDMDLNDVRLVLGGISDAMVESSTDEGFNYYNANFIPSEDIDNDNAHHFAPILFSPPSESKTNTDVFHVVTADSPYGLFARLEDKIDRNTISLFNEYGLLSVSIADLQTISSYLAGISYTPVYSSIEYKGVYPFYAEDKNGKVTITIDWTELVMIGCFGNLLNSVYDVETSGNDKDPIYYRDDGFIWLSLEFGQHGYGIVMNPFAGNMIYDTGEPITWWQMLRTPDVYMNSDYNGYTGDDYASTSVRDVREHEIGKDTENPGDDIGNRFGVVNYPNK